MKAAAAPTLPTAEQAKLVQDTWAEAKKLGLPTVGKLFYQTMFSDFPELPETLFKGVNMVEQQAKLMAMLDSAVGLLGDLDTLVPILQESGVRHGGYGTEPRHYAMVGQSLMKTLAAGLGDKLTPDAKNAWLTVYAVMQHVMLEAQDTPEGRRLFAAYQRRVNAPAVNDDGLPTYHVLDVTIECHNTRRFTFQGSIDLTAGGHMCVLDNGMMRNYTPYHVSASNPAYGGVPTFSIIVKKYEKGPISTYMHSLKAGDVVTMTGPKAPHALPVPEDEEAPAHVVLVGGGTGIAPVYSMAHSICRGHGACPPKTTLIASFANCAEALLVPELKALQNVTVIWNFSRETHEEEVRAKLGLGSDAIVLLKHLTAEGLKQYLPAPPSRVLLCGPAGYNKNARHVFGPLGSHCAHVKTL